MRRRSAIVASAAFAAAVLVVAGAGAASLGKGVATPSLVFVLAGQSNMGGYGKASKGSKSDKRLLVWTGKKWKKAKDPLPLPRPHDKRGVGPGMTFGLAVAQGTGQTVGLIQCAADGTSIGGWQPGKGPYDSCLAQARAAGGTIGGVLFLQGESEAQSADQAAGWLPGFQTMLAAFRQDLPGAWPFLLGQIGSLDQHDFPAQQQVRDAQQGAAAADSTIRLVTTADLPTKDGTHFTVSGYKEIGRRFAAAFFGT
jgi:Carbohydrate esterase, sialic acid-specific acetylesterase